jgi:hypothetical protein
MQQAEIAGHIYEVYQFWLKVATTDRQVNHARKTMRKAIEEGVIPATWEQSIESSAVAAMGRINAAKMFGFDMADDRVLAARKMMMDAICAEVLQ